MGFLRRLFAGPSPAPQERQRLNLRSETLPDGYRRLIQGPALDIVGESNYRAAIETVVGRRPEGHQDVVDAALVWEPDNEYDPNAIAVQIASRTCGYLPKADAARYRQVVEWCQAEGFVPVVRADVSGGWQQPDGSWAHFGVRLYVASPDKLLGRPAPPVPTPSRDHQWVGKVVAFTGDSRYAINGEKLDRTMSEALARQAGMEVHPRVTKAVKLLVNCDDSGESRNQKRAIEYGIPVIREIDFWTTLGLPVEVVP